MNINQSDIDNKTIEHNDIINDNNKHVENTNEIKNWEDLDLSDDLLRGIFTYGFEYSIYEFTLFIFKYFIFVKHFQMFKIHNF